MHHGLLINLAGIASVPLGGIIGAGGSGGPWQPGGSLLAPTPPISTLNDLTLVLPAALKLFGPSAGPDSPDFRLLARMHLLRPN